MPQESHRFGFDKRPEAVQTGEGDCGWTPLELLWSTQDLFESWLGETVPHSVKPRPCRSVAV